MEAVLFLDGQNFVKKLEAVFESEGQARPRWESYDFTGLLDKVLSGIKIDRRIFYFARLKEHPDTKEKSKELIEENRLLKNSLEKQRMEKINKGGEILVFKEKGVDVKIAVDMVTAACDGHLQTAIVGSSDSDLQPAISELNKRNVHLIYLGFEIMPNKGLMYTTHRTILIRNSEVLEFAPRKLL